MTTRIDYEGATSFVALVNGLSWHRSADWPDYLVSQIEMVATAEPYLPDGVEVLEWPEGSSEDEMRQVVLGKRA